jgi:hypothetical protein
LLYAIGLDIQQPVANRKRNAGSRAPSAEDAKQMITVFGDGRASGSSGCWRRLGDHTLELARRTAGIRLGAAEQAYAARTGGRAAYKRACKLVTPRGK